MGVQVGPPLANGRSPPRRSEMVRRLWGPLFTAGLTEEPAVPGLPSQPDVSRILGECSDGPLLWSFPPPPVREEAGTRGRGVGAREL